jgi:serine/threonine-protein kinase HipA
VHDQARAGALRFRRGPGQPFLDDSELAAPPLARLRELEQAARALQAPGAERRPQYAQWLAALLAPGSSLGGARPKASFTDADASLWLAKFPARDDRRDMGAWEYLLHRLAREAGIDVPESRLLRLCGTQRTFCARRFDRAAGSRRMIASAMTLLGRREGEAASYLELAQLIQDQGAPGAIEADLEQLFRRAAFNVMAGNRDDHLRNHAFLRTRGGWRLAPAYDMNPSVEKQEHALALDERLSAPDLALVEATAPYYRVAPRRARRILGELREALSGWRRRARALQIPAPEIALVAPAFAHAAK